MAAAPLPRRMTVANYLAFDAAATDARYEYYAGRVVAMAGRTPQHAEICAYTISALLNALRGGPCRVYTSDARVQVAADHYVYPDVTVSCAEADRANRESIAAPRVVFEVLSPSTAYKDKGIKLDLYRGCPTIEEYVLIDTERPHVELYRRAGVFMQYFALALTDALDLPSIGVTIPVIDLYGDVEFPTPDSGL